MLIEIDDPAAIDVFTRPMGKDPGCEENILKISSWLGQCLNDHPDCATMASTFIPTRLIEIEESLQGFHLRLRHMTGRDTVPYNALSYCWGGDQEIKCTTTLIDSWIEAIPFDVLPKTIQDAITVCRKLGTKYLWIDSFCIIQDDANDKAIEIAQMPQVYRNAVLTIAAAGAKSVREGFLGERVATETPKEVFQLPFRCSSGEIGSITILKVDESSDPINERAWTLQERLLSARTIEFGSRQLRWICQTPKYEAGFTDGWRKPKESWDPKETLDHEIFRRKFDELGKVQLDRNGATYKSAMKHWYNLVGKYTHRKLTFPTDRILAISGIAELYGRVFGDEYLCGLWKSTLGDALLWKTSLASRNLPRPVKYQGPSWSWTAVNGSVEFPELSFNTTNKKYPEIFSCTTRLVDEKAPYGAIAEASGVLVLTARLLPACVNAETPRSWVYQPKYVVTFLKMNNCGGFGQCEISCDALEPLDSKSDSQGFLPNQ